MNRRGFTLIEILATITIATVMITAIFPMLNIGQKGVYKSSDKNYAVLAAADLMEVVRGTEFSVLPPRENPYSVQEIRQLLYKGDNARRNLVFGHVYEDKFAIGVFIQLVAETENSTNPEDANKSMRQCTVVVRWESVMDKSKKEEVRLTSLYREHTSG
tara:strand:+ start:149 stop:625 length:477 start_codon:yes stop_codon:yes gene_type:complete